MKLFRDDRISFLNQRVCDGERQIGLVRLGISLLSCELNG